MLIVGEYLTPQEVDAGGPFFGGLGKVFRGLLRSAGIDPDKQDYMHVINRPIRHISQLYGPKTEGAKGVRAIRRGAYILPQYMPDVERTRELVRRSESNVVIAVGTLAMWALTEEASLMSARGRITPGLPSIGGKKVLCIYSMQELMANWNYRPIMKLDLAKALRESYFPEIRRPQRFIHLYPTIAELEEFYQEFIAPSEFLSVDIETKGTMITCVGLSPSPDRSLVIPFYSSLSLSGNYWKTQIEERLAWLFIRRMLALRKRTLGQNFQFDAQHLWRSMGIKSPGFSDDTMIAHHAMYPELRKGLGFLGSIYTDELSWKDMGKTSKRGNEE